MVHPPGHGALVTLLLSLVLSTAVTSSNARLVVKRQPPEQQPGSSNHSHSHSHSLGQWLYGVPAVTLPEFFSTDPDEFDWEPHPSGDGGTISVKKDVVRRGQTRPVATSSVWAAMRWTLDATPWRGQRVELTGALTTQGMRSGPFAGAGLFVRVADIGGLTLACDNMMDRRIVSYQVFQSLRQIVIDVPTAPQPINDDTCPLVGPALIHLGFYLSGQSGSVTIGRPGGFRVVSTGVPVTSLSCPESGPGIW